MKPLRFLSLVTFTFLLVGCQKDVATKEIQNDTTTQVEVIQDTSKLLETKTLLNNLDSKFFGRWTYTQSGKTFYITQATELNATSINMVDNDHITITNDYGLQHLIRSGISDVKILGEVAVVTQTTDAQQAPSKKAISASSLYLTLKHKGYNLVKKYKLVITTDENKFGKIKNGILYLKKDENGNLVIPLSSELTMPTGEIECIIQDQDKNQTSHIDVNLTNEQTDIGVVTLTDKPYNFKSHITRGSISKRRWASQSEFYFTNTSYATLSICNIGTEAISGANFEVKPHNGENFGRFSLKDLHKDDETSTYISKAMGFDVDECKMFDLEFDIKAPEEETEYKIDIAINDNFNNLTWHDYATIKVAPYTSKERQTIYIDSNEKIINGYLVTKGNTILKVHSDESIIVPKTPLSEYELVLSAQTISDEDVYEISTDGQMSNEEKEEMYNFLQVGKNEPDNNKSTATELALTGDSVMSYLSREDIDYYIIKDLPRVKEIASKLYHRDDNLYISFFTDLNTSAITKENFSVVDENGLEQPLNFEIRDAQNLTLTFENNLTNGTYTLNLIKLQSSGGNIPNKPLEHTFEVEDVKKITATEIDYSSFKLRSKDFINGYFYDTKIDYIITKEDKNTTITYSSCRENTETRTYTGLNNTLSLYDAVSPIAIQKTGEIILDEKNLEDGYYFDKIWDDDENFFLVTLKNCNNEDATKLVLYTKKDKTKEVEIELAYTPKNIVLQNNEVYVLTSTNEQIHDDNHHSSYNHKLYKYSNNLTSLEEHDDLNISSSEMAVSDNTIYFNQEQIGDRDRDGDGDDDIWNNLVEYNTTNFSFLKTIKEKSSYRLSFEDNKLIYNRTIYNTATDSEQSVKYDLKNYPGDIYGSDIKKQFLINKNYLYTYLYASSRYFDCRDYDRGYNNEENERPYPHTLTLYDTNNQDDIQELETLSIYHNCNDDYYSENIEIPFISHNYLYIGSMIYALPLP